jgi:hypothetical protein
MYPIHVCMYSCIYSIVPKIDLRKLTFAYGIYISRNIACSINSMYEYWGFSLLFISEFSVLAHCNHEIRDVVSRIVLSWFIEPFSLNLISTSQKPRYGHRIERRLADLC